MIARSRDLIIYLRTQSIAWFTYGFYIHTVLSTSERSIIWLIMGRDKTRNRNDNMVVATFGTIWLVDIPLIIPGDTYRRISTQAMENYVN